jgi:hypothetical protein
MFPSLAPAEPCCWRIPRAVMNRRSAHVGELTLPPWHRVLWCGTHGWGFFSFVFLTREARGFVGGRWTARWGFRILNVGGEPDGNFPEPVDDSPRRRAVTASRSLQKVSRHGCALLRHSVPALRLPGLRSSPDWHDMIPFFAWWVSSPRRMLGFDSSSWGWIHTIRCSWAPIVFVPSDSVWTAWVLVSEPARICDGVQISGWDVQVMQVVSGDQICYPYL